MQDKKGHKLSLTVPRIIKSKESHYKKLDYGDHHFWDVRFAASLPALKVSPIKALSDSTFRQVLHVQLGCLLLGVLLGSRINYDVFDDIFRFMDALPFFEPSAGALAQYYCILSAQDDSDELRLFARLLCTAFFGSNNEYAFPHALKAAFLPKPGFFSDRTRHEVSSYIKAQQQMSLRR